MPKSSRATLSPDALYGYHIPSAHHRGVQYPSDPHYVPHRCTGHAQKYLGSAPIPLPAVFHQQSNTVRCSGSGATPRVNPAPSRSRIGTYKHNENDLKSGVALGPPYEPLANFVQIWQTAKHNEGSDFHP